jgi:hypothetical protein
VSRGANLGKKSADAIYYTRRLLGSSLMKRTTKIPLDEDEKTVIRLEALKCNSGSVRLKGEDGIASRAFFGRLGRHFLFFLEPVHLLDDHEQSEGHDF